MEAMQQALEVTINRTNTMIFPAPFTTPQQSYSSLSAIEYAALATGQPCSGTHWLDVMLAKARRERLAGQALTSLDQSGISPKEAAGWAVAIADALIAALEGGDK